MSYGSLGQRPDSIQPPVCIFLSLSTWIYFCHFLSFHQSLRKVLNVDLYHFVQEIIMPCVANQSCTPDLTLLISTVSVLSNYPMNSALCSVFPYLVPSVFFKIINLDHLFLFIWTPGPWGEYLQLGFFSKAGISNLRILHILNFCPFSSWASQLQWEKKGWWWWWEKILQKQYLVTEGRERNLIVSYHHHN